MRSPSGASGLPLSGTSGNEAGGPGAERFYFRVVDDSLFVFDGAMDVARVLNASAARLFLCLPDAFAEPALVAREAGLEAEADWRGCLAQWAGLGWVETDAAGRVRLARRVHPAGAGGPAPAPAPPTEGRPVGHCRFRLGGRSFEVRLFAAGDWRSPPDGGPDAENYRAQLAGAERLLGFLDGPADPAAGGDAPEATVELGLAPDGFTLRCGERLLCTPHEPVAQGKLRLWLLALAYREVPPAILIHGAALALPAGSVILAGVSGAGKSTLSAYLAGRGWRYGTDDSLAIGFEAGRAVVLPFPGAISLKPGSLAPLAGLYPALRERPLVGAGPKLGRYLPVPAEQHLPARGDGNRVRCFVFPRFEAGSPTRVTAISAAEALLALMTAEFDIGEAAGEREFDAFFDAIETLPRYAVTYGDLAEMEAALGRLVAGDPGRDGGTDPR